MFNKKAASVADNTWINEDDEEDRVWYETEAGFNIVTSGGLAAIEITREGILADAPLYVAIISYKARIEFKRSILLYTGRGYLENWQANLQWVRAAEDNDFYSREYIRWVQPEDAEPPSYQERMKFRAVSDAAIETLIGNNDAALTAAIIGRYCQYS
ncbi:MAG: hypothetical protein WBB28_01495 [Crinalium sp.]